MAKTKEYAVHCVITGTCVVYVEAKDEEQAKEKALNGEYENDPSDVEWEINEAEEAEINE